MATTGKRHIHQPQSNNQQLNLIPTNSGNAELAFRAALAQFGYLAMRSHELYHCLRDFQEAEILYDLESKESLALEHKLWKVTHYKLIEEFRKQFKLAQTSKGKTTQDRSHVQLVVTRFRDYLNVAEGFYLSFLAKIYHLYGFADPRIILELDLVLQDQTDSLRNFKIKKPTPNAHRRVNSCVYRCLIALGDIARYRDSTLDKKVANYELARKYYWLALHLIPDNGNTYNQLAVLDTYCDRYSFALDLYLRSLCVSSPFLTALSNLEPLFQKANVKIEPISFEISFVLLVSLIFNPRRDLKSFAQQYHPVLAKIVELLDEPNVPIDKLYSFFTVSFGVIYIIANEVGGAEAMQFDEDGNPNEKDRALSLMSQYLIEMSSIILQRFVNLLTSDFQILGSTCEAFLPLVKLVVQFVESSWFIKFSSTLPTNTPTVEAYLQVFQELKKKIALSASLISKLVSERYPGALFHHRVLLDEDLALTGCSLLDVSLNDPTHLLESTNIDEGEKVRIRCNQIVYGVRRMCLGGNNAKKKASSLREQPLLYEKIVKGISNFSTIQHVQTPPQQTGSGILSGSSSQWKKGDSETIPAANSRSPLKPLSSQQQINKQQQPASIENIGVSGEFESGSQFNEKPSLPFQPGQGNHMPQSSSGSSAVSNKDPSTGVVSEYAERDDELNTLSFLGLGTGPLAVSASILPTSAVKRSSISGPSGARALGGGLASSPMPSPIFETPLGSGLVGVASTSAAGILPPPGFGSPLLQKQPQQQLPQQKQLHQQPELGGVGGGHGMVMAGLPPPPPGMSLNMRAALMTSANPLPPPGMMMIPPTKNIHQQHLQQQPINSATTNILYPSPFAPNSNPVIPAQNGTTSLGKPRDALFSRLSAYQQSMVSPHFWEDIGVVPNQGGGLGQGGIGGGINVPSGGVGGGLNRFFGGPIPTNSVLGMATNNVPPSATSANNNLPGSNLWNNLNTSPMNPANNLYGRQNYSTTTGWQPQQPIQSHGNYQQQQHQQQQQPQQHQYQ